MQKYGKLPDHDLSHKSHAPTKPFRGLELTHHKQAFC